MKNNYLLIVPVLILLAGGFYLALNKQPTVDDAMMPKQEVKQQDTMMPKQGTTQEDAMAKDEASMQQTGGQYLNYSADSFDAAAGKRRVLFFYASWCPTCIPADKSFAENTASLPADVVVLRVNYNDPDTDDAENALAEKYGITYQHTFVQIDGEGNEVTKWNGGAIEELISNLK